MRIAARPGWYLGCAAPVPGDGESMIVAFRTTGEVVRGAEVTGFDVEPVGRLSGSDAKETVRMGRE